MKNYIISALIALCVSTGALLWIPELLTGSKSHKIEYIEVSPAKPAVFTLNEKNEIVPLDFTSVASKVMPAVVHIRSSRVTPAYQGPRHYPSLPAPFRDFFKDEFFFYGPNGSARPPQYEEHPHTLQGTGSGVIINNEGYIVTNNHVIVNADEIEVTLHDNRTFKASIIGTDPSTDLALLQIKAKELPSIPFVNSNEVKVGEWVLAVGNPFNLNSTVTAGIVSAKSRSLNILQDQYPIESFIQTDAAINMGNSGGALVNLQGGLIGINTAIASPTGAYTGYGFAIPSNIVSKIVEDLLEYGIVQRGYMGVSISNLNSRLMKEKNLNASMGVYVDSVSEKSAAYEAGIKAGDVIQEIENISVRTVPELQEIVARHRPGDILNVKVNRDGKDKSFKVKLKNLDGEAKFLTSNKKGILNILGAEFKELDSSSAKRLGLDGGVQVSRLQAGKFLRHTQMKEGFIITKVDGKPVRTLDELAKSMENKEGGILIEGVYEDIPGVHYYAFGL